MDFPCTLTPDQWARVRLLARTDQFSFGVALVDKIKAGERPWTDKNALEVHRVTKGEVPCWAMRPDIFREGQLPPALADLAA